MAIGITIHEPRCGVCAHVIARIDPASRASDWTHGKGNGRAPLVTTADKKLNRDHTPRL